MCMAAILDSLVCTSNRVKCKKISEELSRAQTHFRDMCLRAKAVTWHWAFILYCFSITFEYIFKYLM